MNGAFYTLLSNEYFVWCAMALIIFGLTQLFKLPIKAATKHIQNERTRGIVNLVILLIPFALGMLGEFLFDGLYLHNSFTGIVGLQYGSSSLLVYTVFEKLAKKTGLELKLDNPYDTDEGKAVKELVEEIQADGKIDKKDASAVDELWKTISKDKKDTK